VKLSLRWVRKERHAPMPAWPVSTRMPFDRAAHSVIAGDNLFFGSSVTGKVHALNAATGEERWSFFTGGPVRFAPALWKDRVFVASDDGFLYCLNAADGKLVWSKRGGPDGRLLLGNDRMISRWPARGGPLVVDDVVYFGAGIWPSEGIYLHALDAATGKVRWVNSDSGSIYMGQPHGGANAESGVSSQGYLVAAGDKLLVPTGRAVPAVFDRATGKFLYFQLQQNGHKGGTSTLATGSWFINAGASYDLANGNLQEAIGPGEVAATADGVIRTTIKEAIAYKWADKVKTDRKGNKVNIKGLDKLWSLADVPGGSSILVAGKSLICGGDGKVTRADTQAKKAVWSAEVEGTPLGLAVAGGRLYVSTDRGNLYCFDGKGDAKPTVHEQPTDKPSHAESIAARAEQIVKEAGVTDGWCVDLRCGDGALLYELAKRTRLKLVGIDSDPEKVAAARMKLQAAGLYGSRVTVFQGDPSASPFPRYFADLVVTSSGNIKPSEAHRLQRPFGGVAFIGPRKSVRGPLEGAGNWTHQYADAANTCCSSDSLVKSSLGMLWFRDSDFDMPSRHGRAPAPLFLDGRLIVEGMNGIRAVDAYNGRTLWEYPLPSVLKPYHGEHLVGTAATNSNLCLTADSVFVRVENRCLRLDPATGKKLAEFTAPKLPDGKSAPWGYIATDGGLLFGSLSDTKHIVKFAYGKSDMSQLFTESRVFFALDARTGKEKWRYDAKHAIRHNAITVGGGRVYLIDRPLAEKDRADGDKEKEHPQGELLALDADTGKVIWRKTEDVYGTLLALGTKHDVLLMSYQPTRFKLPSEVGGSLTAFRASDGKQLWERKANYLTRPVLNDRTVYVQGGAWDLVTGDTRPFTFKRSYGCGQLAGCTNLMVFRSATLGYFDLLKQKGTIDYGGIRPGCWINAIPAGGLVLVPDATSGCQCSYLNQAWIALQPMEK
jgi:outer membrane protein assembly factor BamB